jgi:hypothetical protein
MHIIPDNSCPFILHNTLPVNTPPYKTLHSPLHELLQVGFALEHEAQCATSLQPYTHWHLLRLLSQRSDTSRRISHLIISTAARQTGHHMGGAVQHACEGRDQGGQGNAQVVHIWGVIGVTPVSEV